MTVDGEIQNDEAIVLRVIKGDGDAFGLLIDRYEEKLARYIRRFIQNNDDVEDILQVIFIKSYTHLQSFDTTRSFNSWIYRIAHNESVNYLKRKGNEKISFTDFFDTFFPHPFAEEESDSHAILHERKDQLEMFLNKLSPKYREVLVLYYYEDLSYQEISDVLQIPIATVGVRIKRAREALAKVLPQAMNQEVDK